jgi:molybdopterin converting factor small subunit
VVRPVRIRLYAAARRLIGESTVSLPVPPSGLPARALVAELAHRFPRLAPTLRVSRFLRNDRYLADLGETVAPGDEFAVHPPYGGG